MGLVARALGLAQNAHLRSPLPRTPLQPGDRTERESQRTPRQPGAMGDAASPEASAMGDGENEGEDGQHEESTVADEAQALLDKFASVQILKSLLSSGFM